jgi:hypothetical protein
MHFLYNTSALHLWWEVVRFYFPTEKPSFYEDSHIILHVESTTLIRDHSRKIVTKNPRSRGDFSIGEAVKLYTKNFFVISLTQVLYHFFSEIKFFYQKIKHFKTPQMRGSI